jgi:monoamine oxidase
MRISRRRFSAALSAALAGVSMGRSAVSAEPDVAIVGAGAAGLAAAHVLRDAGRSVTILEALPRIGGRAMTDRSALGLTFDRGAAYLEAATANPLRLAARRFGMTVSAHEPEERLYEAGQPASPEAERLYGQAYDEIGEALEHGGEDWETDSDALTLVQAVLERNPWGRTAAAIAIVTDDGVDLKDLSVRDWMGRDGGAPYLAVREGIGTLIARIGEGVPVALNTPVTAIAETAKGVRLETPSGPIAARAAIVTVSPAVLASGAIRFADGLAKDVLAAAGGLPMGHLEKVALAFEPDARILRDPMERVLVNKVEDGRARYAHVRPHGLPMVIVYAGGSYAKGLALAGKDEAFAEARELLAAMLGAKALQGLTRWSATGWAADPRFLGAYAAAKPGGLKARLDLAKPFSERVLLAGEALGERRHQSLDGAWASGRKAAMDLLKRALK